MVKRIENTFTELISELDIAEERISKLKDGPIVMAHTETQRVKEKIYYMCKYMYTHIYT